MPISHTSCAHHPEHTAVAECDRCGKPICPECTVDDLTTGKPVCADSCGVTTDAEKQLEDELISGLEHPIRDGFRLWRRSLRSLALNVALPMSFIILGFYKLGESTMSGELGMVVLMFIPISFTIALTGAVLSNQHTHDLGSPWLIAAQRYLPWLLSVALMATLTFAGYLLFIIPGMYLALRLFWADELALAHGLGPVASLRESWRITNGESGEIMRFQLAVGFVQAAFVIPAAVILSLTMELLGHFPIGFKQQLVLAVVITLVMVLVYSFTHACELAFFYGMLVSQRREEIEVEEEDEGLDPAQAADERVPVRRATRKAGPGELICPHCDTPYNPADYRSDLELIQCSTCRSELPGPAASGTL